MKPISHAPDRRQIILFGIGALTLAGCGDIVGPPAAAQIYVLEPGPGPAPATGAPKVDWALAIDEPDASASLDTNRIALRKSDTTLDYYANATWPDQLPDLVQTALLAGFEKTGRIDSVARGQDALHADYILFSDIRDFAAHYDTADGAPSVTVTIIAHMAEARSRQIVANLDAVQTVPASANSVSAVVSAFDTALTAAIGEIVAWALGASPAGIRRAHALKEPMPRGGISFGVP